MDVRQKIVEVIEQHCFGDDDHLTIGGADSAADAILSMLGVGWQPIDTAPQIDGYDRELLVSDGTSVYLAFWDDDERAWLDAANHNGFQHAQLAPTHWMPKPQPPALPVKAGPPDFTRWVLPQGR